MLITVGLSSPVFSTIHKQKHCPPGHAISSVHWQASTTVISHHDPSLIINDHHEPSELATAIDCYHGPKTKIWDDGDDGNDEAEEEEEEDNDEEVDGDYDV